MDRLRSEKFLWKCFRTGVQLSPPPPVKKPCAAIGTRLLLCSFSVVFPYVFPLQIGNTFYVPLHAVGAGLFHLFCDVPIHVQSKGGGMVAQIALDSLDVIPGPK